MTRGIPVPDLGQGLGDVADLVRSVVESLGDDAELREEDSEFKRKGGQAEGESRWRRRLK